MACRSRSISLSPAGASFQSRYCLEDEWDFRIAVYEGHSGLPMSLIRCSGNSLDQCLSLLSAGAEDRKLKF